MVKEDFEKLMIPFTEFYSTTLSKIQTIWWFNTFKNISTKDFSDAINWHIAHDQYNTMPAPGKITAALESVKEERSNPDYPAFTTLWVSVIDCFPGKQDYPHYPPESEKGAWKDLYDMVVRIPASERQSAVDKAMSVMEKKYNVGVK